jgi:hypothetical protein
VAAAVRALGRGAERFVVESRGPRLGPVAQALRDPAALKREIARLDAAPPEGIERVHPSWWSRPPASSLPAAQALLERAATAHLVAMAAPSGERDPLEALELLPAGPLAERVASLGRRRVAAAFSAAAPGALAQLCARIGEPEASALLAEARALKASHQAARAAQRSLLQVAADEVADGPSLVFQAGARWLAPTLAARGGDLLQRVAQRLPVERGRQLTAEAATPATDAERAECEQAVAQLR